jgi:hypothetical protein
MPPPVFFSQPILRPWLLTLISYLCEGALLFRMGPARRKPRPAKKAVAVDEPSAPQEPPPQTRNPRMRDEALEPAPKNAKPASRVGEDVCNGQKHATNLSLSGGKRVVTAQDTPKKKKRLSCIGCRRRKTKCEYQDDTVTSCKQCIRLSEECSQPPVRAQATKPKQTRQMSQSAPNQANSADTPLEGEPVLSEVSDTPRKPTPQPTDSPHKPAKRFHVIKERPRSSSKKGLKSGDHAPPSDQPQAKEHVDKEEGGEVIDLEISGSSDESDGVNEFDLDSDDSALKRNKRRTNPVAFLSQSFVDVDELEAQDTEEVLGQYTRTDSKSFITMLFTIH